MIDTSRAKSCGPKSGRYSPFFPQPLHRRLIQTIHTKPVGAKSGDASTARAQCSAHSIYFELSQLVQSYHKPCASTRRHSAVPAATGSSGVWEFLHTACRASPASACTHAAAHVIYPFATHVITTAAGLVRTAQRAKLQHLSSHDFAAATATPIAGHVIPSSLRCSSIDG